MRKLKSPQEITYVYTSLRDELEEYKHKYNLMKTNANQLAKRIDKLEEENKESEEAVYYWQKQYDLKQEVIDKAIEYLNQPYRDNFDYSRAELLDILQGSE